MSTSAHDFTRVLDLDPETVKCPYPVFSAMREAAPVFVPEAEAWVITRYADIADVSRRPEVFSSEMPTGPVLVRQRGLAIQALLKEDPALGAELAKLRGGTRVLLFADPPDHGRQRKLVNRAFTPGKVKSHEPMIREIAESLVGTMAERGVAEVVGDLGVPLPLMVIARLLGVPDGDLKQFKEWSDAVVKSIGNNSFTTEEVRATLLSQYGLFQYFGEQIRERRTQPRGDMISDVLEASIGDEPLSDAEVMNMLLQFLVAGNETTTKVVASAVRELAADPDLAGRLRENPALLPTFVDEMLRLESPIQMLYRTAVAPAEVGGVSIAQGEHLLLVYASANRDGSKFDEADGIDLGRPNASAHMAFGVGNHFCLGASLARAEVRIGIEVLLARLDDIRPLGGTDLAALEYEPSYVIHGPRRLDIEFSARPAQG